jgi:hypothetical protein
MGPSSKKRIVNVPSRERRKVGWAVVGQAVRSLEGLPPLTKNIVEEAILPILDRCVKLKPPARNLS